MKKERRKKGDEKDCWTEKERWSGQWSSREMEEEMRGELLSIEEYAKMRDVTDSGEWSTNERLMFSCHKSNYATVFFVPVARNANCIIIYTLIIAKYRQHMTSCLSYGATILNRQGSFSSMVISLLVCIAQIRIVRSVRLWIRESYHLEERRASVYYVQIFRFVATFAAFLEIYPQFGSLKFKIHLLFVGSSLM